ncbi:hypothetical protein [Actinomyces sp. 565]|uniref:variant leucine-rich repeat-containing protein n=1 Tax=Actinomyces sp. 565 TaxID=2057794 RepID=UPI0013A6F77F|nr:hypothetical protein [Actinomyces sp. 565]NDR53410.1 hypothetical protein [Actinomyces sp. 565]
MDMIPGDAANDASSPKTSPDRLEELADNYPELHARIVVNPACPEGLRQWILSLGSSEVRRAWEQHQGAQQPPGGAMAPAAGPVPPRPGVPPRSGVPSQPGVPPQPMAQPKRSGGPRAILVVVLVLVALFMLYQCAYGVLTTLSDSSHSGNAADTQDPSAGDLVSPAPDDAVEAFWIQSPSQNISCELHDDIVGCSVAERYYAEAGQEDCSQSLFSIGVADGWASLSCGNDFIGSADGVLITLDYGSSAANDTFACTSRESGMTCWNQVTGSGFTVSRTEYTVF